MVVYFHYKNWAFNNTSPKSYSSIFLDTNNQILYISTINPRIISTHGEKNPTKSEMLLSSDLCYKVIEYTESLEILKLERFR